MRKLAALGLLSMTGCSALNTLKAAPGDVVDAGTSVISFIGMTLVNTLVMLFRGFFGF